METLVLMLAIETLYWCTVLYMGAWTLSFLLLLIVDKKLVFQPDWKWYLSLSYLISYFTFF